MKTSCQACDAVFSLPENALGRSVRCPKCGAKVEPGKDRPVSPTPPLGLHAASGEPLPIDRVSGGLSALGGFVGFLVAVNLLAAGVIASGEDRGSIMVAVAVACGVIPLWLWWVSVSLTVRLLVQIERNTRRQ